MIRFLRNKSDEVRWGEKIKLLYGKHAQREYTEKYLREGFKAIKFSDRYKYLQETNKPKEVFDLIITGYHPSTRQSWI